MPATSQGHSDFPQAVYDESLLASAPAATKEQIQVSFFILPSFRGNLAFLLTFKLVTIFFSNVI